MWTCFKDMHSGGGRKEDPYEYIYIEAPEEEAKVIFYNRFGHNPERVTCTCCGDDYSISECETLEQATGYERNCDYDKNKGYIESPRQSKFGTYELIPLDTHIQREEVLVIRADEIKPNERAGDVPVE